MFAGITWGQFALYVGLAVVVYYLAVILVYYRMELSEKISKSAKNTSREPRPPAVTHAPDPVSPIGASVDYGNQLPLPAENQHPLAVQAVALPDKIASPIENSPAELPHIPFKEPPVDPDDPARDSWAEEACVLEEPVEADPEPGENEAYITGEVNVETELIGFEAGEAEEVNEGGIALPDLGHTIELLRQEEISPEQEKELARQVALLQETRLLAVFQEQIEGACDKIARLTKQAMAGGGGEGPEEPASPGPARAEAFADVDIKLLIKDLG